MVLSSTSPDVLLAGKVVGVGSVALLQQLVWIGAGVGLFHLRAPLIARFGVTGAQIPSPNVSAGAAALLVLFFVLGFVLYAALFAAVGAMVSNQEDAQQASMPVVMLLVLSMVFMYPTLLNPTSTLARVTSWFPLTAPILMPLRMTMLALPWYEIVATVLGIALMAALVVWLAARIYRVGLLMYGKRPSVGELMRWVRYAS